MGPPLVVTAVVSVVIRPVEVWAVDHVMLIVTKLAGGEALKFPRLDKKAVRNEKKAVEGKTKGRLRPDYIKLKVCV